MKIFLDTSAWLALQVKNDIANQAAKEYFTNLKAKRSLLYSNDYILLETYTRLIYGVNLEAAKKFRQFVQQAVQAGELVLLEVDNQTLTLAWTKLEQYSDQQLSLADATIMAHLEIYHLDSIFSFDQDFKKCNLETGPKL